MNIKNEQTKIYFEKKDMYLTFMRSVAYNLFQSADGIRLYDDHEQLNNLRGDQVLFGHAIDKLRSKSEQPILNFIKICTAFEIILKAELLAKAYIVHIPKDNKLRQTQKDRPLTASSDISTFPVILDQTITFTTLLKPAYKAIIGFEEKLYTIISVYNDERNKLHFLPTLGKIINKSNQSEYSFLIDWMKSYQLANLSV